MERRLVGVIVALAVGVLACGSAGTEVDSSAPRAPRAAPERVAAETPADPGTRLVRYGDLELTVPASWPVYDLAADPTTCVRYDVNAVYLGSPSPDMQCPAQVIGRADAVLVEPTYGSVTRSSQGSESGGVSATEVNGLGVEVDDSGSTEHELVVTAPAAQVTVTLSYGDSDSVAQQIVRSLRMAG